MKATTAQQKTAKYYQKMGSRIGYRLVMKRSQHFGYYDNQHTNEDTAQEKYHGRLNDLLDLRAGMAVLDAGCGQGVVACYLAQHNDVDVTGVTITPHEVSNAQKRAHDYRIGDRTHFQLADYAALPYSDNTFDRVYTTESLSHAPSVDAVIKELTRVLKPGGVLVCAEYEMDHQNFNEEAERLAALIKDHAAIHGVYQFSPGQFVRTLQKNRLTVLHEYDWTKHVKPSFDRLRRLAKPLAGIVKRLHLEKHFINVAAATLYADGVEDGVFAYKVYVVQK